MDERMKRATHVRGRCRSATNKEDPACVTAWMDPEGLMLSEVSQRKANIIRSHLLVKSGEKKKTNQSQQKQHSSGSHYEARGSRLGALENGGARRWRMGTPFIGCKGNGNSFHQITVL